MSMHAPILGPCAWLGKDMIRSTRWIRDLRPADIEQIDTALGAVERRGLAWQEIKREDFPLPGLAELFSGIREELENGCGMMKLRGLPVGRYSEDQLRKLYYGLGCNVGTPVFQNRRGELMRLIRDEGGDVGKRYGQIERVRMADGKPFLSSYARTLTNGALPVSYRPYRRGRPALRPPGGQRRGQHHLQLGLGDERNAQAAA